MSLKEKILACSTSFSDKRKTFYDPKALSDSNYKVENLKEKIYSLVKMDGCVFDSNETKCDFGMHLQDDNTIHFIELKGSDNNKGLMQLIETINNTKECYKGFNKKVRLIVSRAEAPRNLDQKLIDKIGVITDDIMNGKKKTFIKTNNTFTEYIK